MIDVDALRASVDPIAIIGKYVTLRKSGRHWRALCPFHNEKTPSLDFTDDGLWLCRGCGLSGNLFQFIQKIESCDFSQACDIVAGNAGMHPPRATVIPYQETRPPNNPLPPYVPECPWVAKNGQPPAAIYEYRTAESELLGYVARYEQTVKGKRRKWFLPWRWLVDKEKWANVGFSRPTPLFGLELLAEFLDKKVLLVEGEKTCLAGRIFMRGGVLVVTWPGGTGNHRHVDWTPLRGRGLYFWPDAQDGVEAMEWIATELSPYCPKIMFLDTKDWEKGWDVADVVESGQDYDTWIVQNKDRWAPFEVRSNKRYFNQPVAAELPIDAPDVAQAYIDSVTGGIDTVLADAGGSDTPLTVPVELAAQVDAAKEFLAQDDVVLNIGLPHAPRNGNGNGNGHGEVSAKAREAIDYTPGELFTMWATMRLDRNGSKDPTVNVNNVLRVFESDPTFTGLLWYDEFLRKILTKDHGVTREWSDADEIHWTIYIQRYLGLQKIGREVVGQAVVELAYRNRRHCVKDYFNTLKWDGVPRLEMFFHRYFGAVDNEYSRCVSRNFWLSIVARVYEPGCKADNMIILEGNQGIKKSSALMAIATPLLFTEQHADVTSKAFFETLQGKLLIEISEMESFSKADTSRVKQVVSSPHDRFRVPYEKYAKDHPRQCIFVGTTNRDDWNKDETGARRFWPVACKYVDIEGIRELRDQFFAEAIVRQHINYEPHWMTPPSTESEQRRRYVEDPWSDAFNEAILKEWDTVASVWRDRKFPVTELVVSDLLRYVGVPRDRWGKTEQMRAASWLVHNGWRKQRVGTQWRYFKEIYYDE